MDTKWRPHKSHVSGYRSFRWQSKGIGSSKCFIKIAGRRSLDIHSEVLLDCKTVAICLNWLVIQNARSGSSRNVAGSKRVSVCRFEPHVLIAFLDSHLFTKRRQFYILELEFFLAEGYIRFLVLISEGSR